MSGPVMSKLSPTGPEFEWDRAGFLVILLHHTNEDEVRQRINLDLELDRHLVRIGGHYGFGRTIRLHYRLRMTEEILGRGGIPTGVIKESWAPTLSKDPSYV